LKQDQHTTRTGTRTTPADVCHWVQTLSHLHARLAPRFARPEPRRRALAYLQGILSETSRKNGWQLAEHAREARPDGMQRLLSSAVWDTDGVRDDLRAYALEQLGQESAVLAIDETSFPKRGKQSAGIGLQYCGTTGQVENCQVGVFLSYVTAKGHTLIDRELYLPLDWCEDRDRCRAAGIDIRRCASGPSQNWRSRCSNGSSKLRFPFPGSWLIRSMVATWICVRGWKRISIPTCWQFPVMNLWEY
jgi:SRSO17 transposase